MYGHIVDPIWWFVCSGNLYFEDLLLVKVVIGLLYSPSHGLGLVSLPQIKNHENFKVVYAVRKGKETEKIVEIL